MKDSLSNSVRTYNLLLAILPTLVFYRATVQPEYNWGLLAIHGQGTSGDYWIMVGIMLLSWLSFIMYRWYRKKWYFALPLALFGTVAATLLYGYLNNISMVFQGDVYGFIFDIGFLIVALATIMFIGSIFWARNELRDFQSSVFQSDKSQNWKLLGVAILGGFILLLFSRGRGGVHTTLDGIAVALTVAQALVLSYLTELTFTTTQ